MDNYYTKAAVSWIPTLFENIAATAFDKGLEVSIELKNYSSDFNVLGGAFSKSTSTDNGIVLRAYAPDNVSEGGEDDE